MKRLVIWLSLLILSFASTPVAKSDSHISMDKLIIVSQGRYLEFDVEIASTKETRAKGLMFRQSLASNSGMLFDYGLPRKVAMWMKNTYVPLDIMFIDENGIILNIAQNTEPLSLVPIPSFGPVIGVLEVPAGTVKTINIKKGDRVLHPMFIRDN